MEATKTTVTLAAARKRLAAAMEKGEEEVRVRPAGGLGHRVHNLESGLREKKAKAVRQARRLVEAMEQRGLDRVERLVLRGGDLDDSGYSVVYLAGATVICVQHSGMDRAGLGQDRQAMLDRYIRERQEVRS